MSPKRTAPDTACTSREIRNPEYAVSAVSTPIAAVPGSHPSLHQAQSITTKTEPFRPMHPWVCWDWRGHQHGLPLVCGTSQTWTVGEEASLGIHGWHEPEAPAELQCHEGGQRDGP